MIKEKYKQLCLARQFGGINTIEFTQSLYTSSEKPTAQSSTFHFARTSQKKRACLYPSHIETE